MKTYLIGAAAIALVASAPASAQLLGGSGGGLGGGLGSGLGGLGGTATGTLNGSAGRVPLRTVTNADGTLRTTERVRPRRGQTSLTAGADAALDNTTSIAGHNYTQRATTSSNGALSTDAQLLRTRGALAASRSGMQRVRSTASGVPVFVPSGTLAAPLQIPRVAVRSYPAYSRSIYYGPDVVFVSSGDAGYYMDRQYRDLQQGMAGTGARVFRRGPDLVVQLPADVTFAFDRADIRPRFVGALSAFARTLNAYPATDVEIVGHTDSIGSDAYNLGLSERRGRSVADFLVARNASPNSLVVEALGETEPVASNTTVSGRAANRRVELILHPRTS